MTAPTAIFIMVALCSLDYMFTYVVHVLEKKSPSFGLLSADLTFLLPFKLLQARLLAKLNQPW